MPLVTVLIVLAFTQLQSASQESRQITPMMAIRLYLVPRLAPWSTGSSLMSRELQSVVVPCFTLHYVSREPM